MDQNNDRKNLIDGNTFESLQKDRYKRCDVPDRAAICIHLSCVYLVFVTWPILRLKARTARSIIHCWIAPLVEMVYVPAILCF